MKTPLILAVDDAPDLLALIARVLSDNYEVRTAASGAQSLLAAAADPPPVLILLDVEMEGLTGFDVCKALKSNPATATIPVIFITDKGEKKNEMLGFTLGAVDYVAKPVNAEILKLRVATHVALASRRATLEGMVRERTAKLEAAHLEVIHCLGRAMESHESATAGNRFQRIALYRACARARSVGAQCAAGGGSPRRSRRGGGAIGKGTQAGPGACCARGAGTHARAEARRAAGGARGKPLAGDWCSCDGGNSFRFIFLRDFE